jgi:hypothetical protein
VAEWKSRQHLEDHFGWHRRELGVRSVAEYDASAQDTIALGVEFTYRDRITDERHIGYFHRESSRFTATTLDGLIVTHFRTDEDYVASQRQSTYRD